MLSLLSRAAYHNLLDATVLQPDNPTATAIVYLSSEGSPQVITRAEFQQMVKRYAAFFQQQGIQARDLLIIAHTQNLESIYAFWGAMLIGAIPSMFPTLTEKLDADIYMRQMAELVRLSNVKAILTTPEFAASLQAVVTCPVLNAENIAAMMFTSPTAIDANSIALLQHSSGTTGLQKGVALSHRAVLNQLAAYSDALQLNLSRDVIVSWLPLYHDMGLIAGFLLPLVQGIPLVLMSPFDWVKHPAMLLKAISDYGGTLCWLPNFAYNHMARRIRQRDLDGVSLATMRAFINCSEPVRHDSHQQFLAAFASYGLEENMLAVSYAMAENTFAVTQTPIGTSPRVDSVDQKALTEDKIAVPSLDSGENTVHNVSCGAPLMGTMVRVVNADGQDLAEQQVGEIAIHSEYMLTEYYQRPDLAPFRDGWYFTGDMGYLAAGEVYIIGRKKDIIINAGKNIYPQDIEAIVNTVAGIKAGRAVVFGVPDEREGTELIAVVAEVWTDKPDEQHAINRAIRQTVAQQAAATVTYVKLVDDQWLIKTSSGKIARVANREKWLLSQP
jgi:fatty-acyl-CoA synthase